MTESTSNPMTAGVSSYQKDSAELVLVADDRFVVLGSKYWQQKTREEVLADVRVMVDRLESAFVGERREVSVFMGQIPAEAFPQLAPVRVEPADRAPGIAHVPKHRRGRWG